MYVFIILIYYTFGLYIPVSCSFFINKGFFQISGNLKYTEVKFLTYC